ncbi:MAG: ATP-binding cassette domain-containing protein, partial [Acidimicrobiales bacterium]
ALVRGRRGWVGHEGQLLETAWETLARFGLAAKANDYAQTLSGGQKRVLELMRALMARPRLLVLDEPLAGVSPALAEEIALRLMELRDGGMPMLLIEHELDLVERMCDHVVAMGDGKVIAEGTMQALRTTRAVQDAYSFG